MNRRDIIKAIAAVPLASAFGSCHEERASPPDAHQGKRIHTLQILFEGAFSLVLHKNNPNKLVAFVPKPDNGHRELEHDFFFNDPSMPRHPLGKDPAGYHFQLADDGLRLNPDTYINPGFADFTADTEKWRLSERVVTLELPFPNSINFSGRPLHVKFASGRSGLMPTNHVLEYYVEDPDKVKLMCSQLEGKCPASPNCPPGVLRYFFAVSPQIKGDGQKHAFDFFNFILHTCFPDLEERYRLSYIEASEENRGQTTDGNVPKVRPTIFNSDVPPARLLRASAVIDCQSAGLIVRTNSGPMG